jgi:phenylacetaldehyde dehydrogenase
MASFTNDYGQLGAATHAFIDRSHHHFINGEWFKLPGPVLAVVDPASGEPFSEIAAGGADAVDAAVQAAHAALNAPLWRALGPQGREQALLRFAELIDAHADTLAEIETLDNGMPYWLARRMVIPGAMNVLRYMAGWPTKITGQTVDVGAPMPDAQFFGYTTREPVGVVAAIVPWNMPLMMAVWKIAPALAAGCTLVLKPAEDASLTALYLAGLAAQAGFPPGVFNVVTGRGAEAGEALVRHALVSKVTFTGSTRIGKHINRIATDTLKKVTLELGGKSPTLIFDDADLERAIVGAANSIFLNSGQICVAGSRLYVQRNVYDQVVEGIARHADALTVGAGMGADTRLGPLINARQRDHVLHSVIQARNHGATCLTRRTTLETGSGFYVPPVVLAVASQNSALVQEEIFGPVLAVLPFTDEEQVLTLANDSAYGLAATVWSRDIARIHRVLPQIRCGKVSVNTEGFPYPALPEGGCKQSGFGRDLGPEGLDGYLETKSVLIQVG